MVWGWWVLGLLVDGRGQWWCWTFVEASVVEIGVLVVDTRGQWWVGVVDGECRCWW